VRLPIAILLCGTALFWYLQNPVASAAETVTVSKNRFGYASVEAALQDLRTRKDAEVRVEKGWTIVIEPAAMRIWSFTPSDHPAHPALVRRAIVKEGSKVFVEMQAVCEAEKSACDKLVADFDTLNRQTRDSVAAQPGAAADRPQTPGR
jgi:hypothetical protein